MMRLALPVVIGLGVTFGAVPAAVAAHCGEGVSEEVCVDGQGAGFGATAETGGDPQTRPAGSRPGPTKPLSPTYIDRNFVPTCTGNSYFDGGTLCNAAVETCPVEGEVRFWVFETTIVRATGKPAPGSGPELVDTVCLGPDEPVLDPAVAIPALVQREFKSVVVLAGNPDVSPKPDTLVNVATRFRTDAPPSYAIPLTLLNQSVVITARAERYVWHLGDGSIRQSTAANGYLEHVYERAGTRQAFVVIEWSGTFRVNGGSPQPITGTVTTTGPAVAVEVKQARSELVRD